MIDCSDLVVFYFNENDIPLKSGTKIAYAYALKKNKKMINLYRYIFVPIFAIKKLANASLFVFTALEHLKSPMLLGRLANLEVLGRRLPMVLVDMVAKQDTHKMAQAHPQRLPLSQ